MKDGKKVGLSLSGGGYRAAVYHLGTLRKLNEMGVLPLVDELSTVSGGSIIGAFYGLHGRNFEEFERKLRMAVQGNVIRGILLSPRFLVLAVVLLAALAGIVYALFTPYAWMGFVGLLVVLGLFMTFQFRLFPVSRIIEELYDRFFFHGKTLADLGSKPVLVINSTNLETGRPFVFSQDRMGDSTYEFDEKAGSGARFLFKAAKFPIARSVAASACVPFAFSPIRIAKEYFTNPDDHRQYHPALVDGGVYDNQGIHKLSSTKSSHFCDYVIVSDAGNRMPFEHHYTNTVSLLIRTSDVFMRRIKNMQMIQQMFAPVAAQVNRTAYQSLGFDAGRSVDNFVDSLLEGTIAEEVWQAHGITQAMVDQERRAKAEPGLGLVTGAIAAHLRQRIGEADILRRSPSKQELAVARSVGTNLVTLKPEQMQSLIHQAEVITEMQVKLYLPMLLAKEWFHEPLPLKGA